MGINSYAPREQLMKTSREHTTNVSGVESQQMQVAKRVHNIHTTALAKREIVPRPPTPKKLVHNKIKSEFKI